MGAGFGTTASATSLSDHGQFIVSAASGFKLEAVDPLAGVLQIVSVVCSLSIQGTQYWAQSAHTTRPGPDLIAEDPFALHLAEGLHP